MPTETARTQAELYWEDYFKLLFTDEEKAHVDVLLEIAKRYKPRATYYSYDDEMHNRHMYLRAAMQSDMQEQIKRRFKKTWPKIIKEQANLRIYQAEIDEKSKVFVKSGEFHLVSDKDGKQVDDENFDAMVKDANLHSAFKTVNKFIKSMHRAMFKPWWNKKHKQVSIGVWAPYMVNIVPTLDPAAEWWDVDQARAVMFRRMAPAGVLSIEYRQEVWGILPEDVATDVNKRSTHYITGPDGDHKVNDNDENPYTDPRNENKPIYPFVWFADTDETELFSIGEEDALTTNRMVNSLLTDLVHTTHMKAFPPAVHTAGTDNKDMTTTAIHAGAILQLGQGATLTFPTSDLPIDMVWSFIQAYLVASAKLGKLSASVIQAVVNNEESGRALKIRERQLIEDRDDLIGVIHPDVEEAVYRAGLVHNTHCETARKIKLDGNSVKWIPGEMDFPVDTMEALKEDEARIRMNLTTLIEVRMREANESQEEAKQAIIDIITSNQELKKLSAPPPMFELANDKFEAAKQAGGEPPDEPELDEDGKPKPPAKPQAPKAPPPPPAKGKAPEPTDDEVTAAEKAGMNINLYQLAVAILHGAATSADMYMYLNPGVERPEAERECIRNVEFQNKMNALLLKAKKAEQEVLGAKPGAIAKATAPKE